MIAKNTRTIKMQREKIYKKKGNSLSQTAKPPAQVCLISLQPALTTSPELKRSQQTAMSAAAVTTAATVVDMNAAHMRSQIHQNGLPANWVNAHCHR